jgi:hypothetical protein
MGSNPPSISEWIFDPTGSISVRKVFRLTDGLGSKSDTAAIGRVDIFDVKMRGVLKDAISRSDHNDGSID